MRVRVGTSGFSYDAWRGAFYPAGLKGGERLGYYAGRFPTVEINNTFYRMPQGELLARWRDETPEGFVFVLKAPQRITHRERLAGSQESVARFFEAAAALGPKLGPTLFQLPPHFKKDAARLEAFLELLAGRRAAFEFRHASWMDDEVLSLLRAHAAALCVADVDEPGGHGASIVPTADWGYLRLRRGEYPAEALQAWAARLREQAWREAYVFFKHELKGPELAAQLAAACAANP